MSNLILMDLSTLINLNALLLFSTATLAGGLNAIAGGGTFITFPALMFTGLSPIAANATNNTALWVASLASVGAYRKDLGKGQRELFLLSLISIIGGILGSVALLFTSAEIFKQLIPYLLLLATLIFIFGEPCKAYLQRHEIHTAPDAPRFLYLAIAQLAISIYGGFFGAGFGILMLATLSMLGFKNIHRMNALKTFLGGCTGGIATVSFAVAGVIAWKQVVLMAIGGSLGGYFVAHYARQLDPKLVRRFVIVAAIAMTIYFFVRG